MFAKYTRAAACRAMEARLEDYIEGCLASREAGEVEAHVRKCARCATAWEQAKASASLLAPLRERPLPGASPFFAGRVLARIREQRRDQELWKPLETAGRQLCWLAAAAALVLGVFVLRFQLIAPPPPASPAVQQSQVEELINVPVSQPAVRNDILLIASSNAHAR